MSFNIMKKHVKASRKFSSGGSIRSEPRLKLHHSSAYEALIMTVSTHHKTGAKDASVVP